MLSGLARRPSEVTTRQTPTEVPDGPRGPRAPTGADGWVGGIYAGSTSTRTQRRLLHLELLCGIRAWERLNRSVLISVHISCDAGVCGLSGCVRVPLHGSCSRLSDAGRIEDAFCDIHFHAL